MMQLVCLLHSQFGGGDAYIDGIFYGLHVMNLLHQVTKNELCNSLGRLFARDDAWDGKYKRSANICSGERILYDLFY